MMTAKTFVNKLKNVLKYNTLYVYGAFGHPLTETNKAELKRRWSYNRRNWSNIKRYNSNTFGFDCVNLIKGVVMGWCGDKTKKYGGVVWDTSKCPDTNANGMIKLCKKTSTDFSKIKVGAVVWISGHVGVYIGNGEVIECTPKWKNGVQITKLSQRKWVKWGELPFIKYTADKPNVQNSVENVDKPKYHVVKKNENLTVISKRYGTTVTKLVELNNINNPDLIYVGQKIKLP